MPIYFLNPKVEVRGSSVEGKGLFAKEKIEKGEIINVAEGTVWSSEDIEKFSKEQQDMCEYLCYEIYDDHFLCPKDSNHISPDWHMNHSCNPNCGSVRDIFTIAAMRDIEQNEELTFDYAMTDADPKWSMACNCGAANCRKIITGNDWKMQALQEKYAGYFQKNIQEKIDEQWMTQNL